MIERPLVSGLLRGEGEPNHQVSSMELFFDLVFVFAVTQLSHLLLTHLDAVGALQTALLLLALWWAWGSSIGGHDAASPRTLRAQRHPVKQFPSAIALTRHEPVLTPSETLLK